MKSNRQEPIFRVPERTNARPSFARVCFLSVRLCITRVSSRGILDGPEFLTKYMIGAHICFKMATEGWHLGVIQDVLSEQDTSSHTPSPFGSKQGKVHGRSESWTVVVVLSDVCGNEKRTPKEGSADHGSRDSSFCIRLTSLILDRLTESYFIATMINFILGGAVAK